MENTSHLEATGLIRQQSAESAEYLTPRQLEVLALLCQGLPNKQIGRQLNIASATVKIHVAHILRALNVSSRLQAVIAARKLGVALGYHDAAPVERETVAASRQQLVLRLLLGDDDASHVLATVSDWSLAAAAG